MDIGGSDRAASKTYLISIPHIQTFADQKKNKFFEAVRKGDALEVQAVLEEGSISQKDLGLAARTAALKGLNDILGLILENGKISPSDRGELLIYGARHGDQEVLALLLNSGDFPLDNLDDAIMFAEMHGHSKIVAILAESKQKGQEDRGRTLRKAAMVGNLELVSKLLQRGEVSRGEVLDVFMYGVKNGKKEIVEMVLEAGVLAPVDVADAILFAEMYKHLDIADLLRHSRGKSLSESDQARGTGSLVSSTSADIASVSSPHRVHFTSKAKPERSGIVNHEFPETLENLTNPHPTQEEIARSFKSQLNQNLNRSGISIENQAIETDIESIEGAFNEVLNKAVNKVIRTGNIEDGFTYIEEHLGPYLEKAFAPVNRSASELSRHEKLSSVYLQSIKEILEKRSTYAILEAFFEDNLP
jgi:hypothetical protein